MVLSRKEIHSIFSRRKCGKRTILTRQGFRTIKLIDKPAVLRDMWNALSREVNEQRHFLEEEILGIRQQIETEQEKSEAELDPSVPGHFIRKMRGLCCELEQELEGHLANLPGGKSSVLERMRGILGQDFDEQFQIVGRMEEDSLEHMEQLRRRLVRMAKDLQLSEGEVAHLREALATAADGGTASVYKSVQGLSTNDDDVQKKRELLKVLFESNLEIRKSSN